jgi:hypothetical protein
MENIDDEWESFLQNNGELVDNNIETTIRICDKSSQILQSSDVTNIPKCSPIYISTKTKICYLNINQIDIKTIFWKIPIIDYATPQQGIIKKQIKYSSTCKDDVEYISKQLENVKYYEEQIIEHIENPEGRIKYKDQRKISIGISKKDILSYRSKKKRAFFNCFVLIMRILYNNEYKEIHVKVFNTGKLEIPGIQNDILLDIVLNILVKILTPYIRETGEETNEPSAEEDDKEEETNEPSADDKKELNYLPDKSQTVLINSNFNCGYFIDRDKLYDLLKYKYRINSNFDACSYPGIQCKFYYDDTIQSSFQNGQQPNHKEFQEISFMIFRTGSVLVVGKCEEDVLNHIYQFIKNILELEYNHINNSSEQNITPVNKDRKKKIRKKTILID